MKQSNKLVVVVSVVAMLLAALPALAMNIEGVELPSRKTVTRQTVEAQSEATPPAVTQAAAPQVIAPQAAAQPAAPQVEAPAAPVVVASRPIISIYVGPSAPEATPQVQPTAAPQAEDATAPHVEDTAAPHEDAAPAAPVQTDVTVDQPSIIVAPPPAPNKGGDVEFTGNIESLTGTLPNLTLMIAGNTVTTDSSTDIIGTLAVGKLVQVKGSAQSDGSILAVRLKVEDLPGNEGEVEFRGSIVSLPGTPDFKGNWAVGDFTVTVNVSTTIDQTRGAVAVGAIAEVKATRQADGSLLATRIQIEDANEFENEAEFKGVVSDLTGTAPALVDAGERHHRHDQRSDANLRHAGEWRASGSAWFHAARRFGVGFGHQSRAAGSRASRNRVHGAYFGHTADRFAGCVAVR